MFDQSKRGLGAVATMLVIIGLISTVASLSVGSQMLSKVVGLGGQPEDVETLQTFNDNVKRVCQLGEDANDISKTVYFTRKVKLKTVSTEDPDSYSSFPFNKPQFFRANDMSNGNRLLWDSRSSGVIRNCRIKINGGLEVVMDKDQPYEIEISHNGKTGGQPNTRISVSSP